MPEAAVERDDPVRFSTKDSATRACSRGYTLTVHTNTHTPTHTNTHADAVISCMAEHELLRRAGHSEAATNRMLPV